MNKLLTLVQTFHNACNIPQASTEMPEKLADMEIITYQSLLMGTGHSLFKSFKKGDMERILAGLTELAYYSLSAIAKQGGTVSQASISWRHDGFVTSVVRLLSEKIHACSSGHSEDYSALYTLCQYLTNSFINADFDQAFTKLHENNMALRDASGQLKKSSTSDMLEKLELPTTPDLSDYLYE